MYVGFSSDWGKTWGPPVRTSLPSAQKSIVALSLRSGGIILVRTISLLELLHLKGLQAASLGILISGSFQAERDTTESDTVIPPVILFSNLNVMLFRYFDRIIISVGIIHQ